MWYLNQIKQIIYVSECLKAATLMTAKRVSISPVPKISTLDTLSTSRTLDTLTLFHEDELQNAYVFL